MKGGSGKCDLCSTKFQFAPKYAHDAPERLSKLEVFTGLILRAMYNWLPYACRLLLVLGVWLGVLPLMTAYLYQAWMHRPLSVKTRFEWGLVPGDIVNGGILTIIIIISFLSLMSLLDFFRVKWVREGVGNRGENRADKENEEEFLIAPVQIGEDEDCLHRHESTESLREKMKTEIWIADNMMKKHKKNKLFSFRIDTDGQEEEIRIRCANEMERWRNTRRNQVDDHSVQESLFDRHRSDDEEDEYNSNDDDDNHGVLHEGSDENSTVSDREEDSNASDREEDDDDSLLQRMMRLQEMGEIDEEEDDNRLQDNFQNRDAGRMNPQQEPPVNRLFDEENALVS